MSDLEEFVPKNRDRMVRFHSWLFTELPPLPPPPRPIVDFTNCDECPLLAICLASCPGGGFAKLYKEFKEMGGQFPKEEVSDQIHALIERRELIKRAGRQIPIRRYIPPFRGAYANCFTCFQRDFCRRACPAFDIAYSTVGSFRGV